MLRRASGRRLLSLGISLDARLLRLAFRPGDCVLALSNLSDLERRLAFRRLGLILLEGLSSLPLVRIFLL